MKSNVPIKLNKTRDCNFYVSFYIDKQEIIDIIYK